MEDLVNAFKHVEKLCNEIYGEHHGVSLYIDDMLHTPRAMSRNIPGWDDDLKTLRRLRHVRNALVHDDVDDDISYSDEDIEFLDEFYQRIVHRQDPLAQLRKKNVKQGGSSGKNSYSEGNDNSSEESKGCLSQVFLLIFLILLFALLILAGWTLYRYLAG